MLELSDLVIVSVLVWFGWYTLQVARLKEVTVKAVHQRCESQGVQLLDSTVVLHKLRLARDKHGWLRIRRIYSFEFTATGEDRNPGLVSILGKQLEDIELAAHRIH